MTDSQHFNKLFLIVIGYFFGIRFIITCYHGFMAYFDNTRFNNFKLMASLSWYLFGLYSALCNMVLILTYDMLCNREIISDLINKGNMMLIVVESADPDNKSSLVKYLSGLRNSLYNNVVAVKNNVLVIGVSNCFFQLNDAFGQLTTPVNDTLYKTPYLGGYYQFLVEFIYSEPDTQDTPVAREVKYPDLKENTPITQSSPNKKESQVVNPKVQMVNSLFGMLNGVLNQLEVEKVKSEKIKDAIIASMNKKKE